jgi:preprotein translocase subunit YajC
VAGSSFLILIILLGAFWVVGIMPRRRRMQSHQEMQDSIDVGDEVITAGGLHGRVVAVDEGEVRLEIADGVVVTIDRRAIAAVAAEVEVEVEPGDDDEGAEEAPPEGGENQPERVNEGPREPS